LNFSKSGVGASIGVKGARISTGPRGTYFNGGVDGVYYRERIDGINHVGLGQVGSKAKGSVSSAGADRAEPAAHPATFAPTYTPVDSPVATDGPTWGTADGMLVLAAAFIAAILAITLLLSGQFVPSVVALLLGGWIARIAHQRAGRAYAERVASAGPEPTQQCGTGPQELRGDTQPQESVVRESSAWHAWPNSGEHRRTEEPRQRSALHFDLDDRARQRFEVWTYALASLGQAERIWRHYISVYDRRPYPVQVGVTRPAYIDTNVHLMTIEAGDIRLRFFPDHLLAFHHGAYDHIAYRDVTVTGSEYLTFQTDAPPRDAYDQRYAWQHTCLDGTPDLRFKSNPRGWWVRYGALSFASPTGLDLTVSVSSREQIENFVAAFQTVLSMGRGDPAPGYRDEPRSFVGDDTGPAPGPSSVAYQTVNASRPAPKRPASAPHFEAWTAASHPVVVPALPESSSARSMDDLLGMKARTMRVALERPEAWEYKLFLLAWSDAVDALADILWQHDTRAMEGPAESPLPHGTLDWVTARLDDLKAIFDEAGNVVNVRFREALGPPSDPERLLWAGQEMAGVLRDLVAWARRIRGARVEPTYYGVFDVLPTVCDDMIRQLREVPREWLMRVDEAVARAATGERQDVDLTLSFELSNADRLSQAIGALNR
jgi:hypothetical protein